MSPDTSDCRSQFDLVEFTCRRLRRYNGVQLAFRIHPLRLLLSLKQIHIAISTAKKNQTRSRVEHTCVVPIISGSCCGGTVTHLSLLYAAQVNQNYVQTVEQGYTLSHGPHTLHNFPTSVQPCTVDTPNIDYHESIIIDYGNQCALTGLNRPPRMQQIRCRYSKGLSSVKYRS